MKKIFNLVILSAIFGYSSYSFGAEITIDDTLKSKVGTESNSDRRTQILYSGDYTPLKGWTKVKLNANAIFNPESLEHTAIAWKYKTSDILNDGDIESEKINNLLFKGIIAPVRVNQSKEQNSEIFLDEFDDISDFESASILLNMCYNKSKNCPEFIISSDNKVFKSKPIEKLINFEAFRNKNEIVPLHESISNMELKNAIKEK